MEEEEKENRMKEREGIALEEEQRKVRRLRESGKTRL